MKQVFFLLGLIGFCISWATIVIICTLYIERVLSRDKLTMKILCYYIIVASLSLLSMILTS